MKSLHLQKTVRPGSKNQSERQYFDFIISGQSLRSILDLSKADLITPLGWGDNKEYERQVIKILTLREKSELETGRVMLYVCSECGDIGCGAATAIIQDYGDRIIWKEFGYENANGVSETFSIAPMEFERQNYFQAFSKL